MISLISISGSSCMCGCVQDADEDSGAVALEISNLGGVFLVMGVGSFFGIFVSLLEMVLGVKERSDENQVSARIYSSFENTPPHDPISWPAFFCTHT